MGVMVGLGVLVPSALVLSLVYTRSIAAMKEEVRGNLRRIAKTAALLVDGDAHRQFTDASQESSPEYAEAVRPLKQFIDRDPSFKYVYTCVLVDGEVRFVLDPTPTGDWDDDGLDDKSHVMQRYDDPSAEMLQAFEHRASNADYEPYTDDWGTFISGYAPVFDSKGEFVALLGVDVTADKYRDRLQRVESAAVLAGVVALLLSLGVGVAAGLFQRRRHQWAREQAAATEALRDLAESLDGANAQLRFASRRFEQLFNLIPVACFTFDRNGTIYEWNRECERLTGTHAHDVVQKTLFETVVGTDNHEAFHEMINSIFQDRPTLDREWTDVNRSGAQFTVVLNTFPLYAQDGTVTGGIAACADITAHKQLQFENARQMAEIQRAYADLDASRNDLTSMNTALTDANRQLRKLASVDPLTGILNRRSIFKTLEREAAIAKRRSRPLSILMVDIDHFKSLNDTRGHIVGDAVLRAVASRLKTASRMGDHAGRYGGEEFLVVLPDTDADDAVRVAERIRRQVAADDENGAAVTVSVGASTLTEAHVAIEQFIDTADRALYEAKRKGRNRVVHSRDTAQGAA
jgi:diguanylate cyclase (GGDEF)-like protein/PAS domain S-box-containing protein